MRPAPQPRAHRVGALALAACLASVAIPGVGIATPYVPAADDEVLERLPARVGAAAGAERTARAALAADPSNVDLAVATARADVARARREGDPRFLGRAEAALAPWWRDAEPPVPVQLLRATIRQSLHEFDAALVDLRAVTARDPSNPQAWLTTALVEQTRGNYGAARASCDRLLAIAGRRAPVRLAGVACASSVPSFVGDAAGGYARLDRALAARGDLADATRAWALGVLADIAARRGMIAEARRHYVDALAAAPGDALLLASYADVLLTAREPNAVLALLGSESRVDGLLLRIALAERQAGAPGLAAHVTTLGERFAANRLRGDESHLREEARFVLELRDDPGGALALADRNWAQQREPEDARLLLAAALAAGDDDAAGRVVAWTETQRLEDVELARAIAAFHDRTAAATIPRP